MNAKAFFQTLSLMATVSLMTIVAPLQSRAGTMTSGGILPMGALPKFVGEQPVTFCVKHTPKFSLDEAASKAVVRRALADWSETIRSLGDKAPSLTTLSGEKLNVSSSFTEVACSSSTDLVFELGEPSRSSSFVDSNHLGSAGNRDGVIWVARDLGRGSFKHFSSYVDERQKGSPVWTDEARLFNVLLHEIGHILGFGHDHDSVMSIEVLKAQVDLAKPVQPLSSKDIR